MDGVTSEASEECPLILALIVVVVGLRRSAIDGLGEESMPDPILSLIASAIFTDRRLSSSLVEERVGVPDWASTSSVNPASYMPIASSTVKPSSVSDALGDSTVISLMAVSLDSTLLLVVVGVSTKLEVAVTADRKLLRTSSASDIVFRSRLNGNPARSGSDAVTGLRSPNFLFSRGSSTLDHRSLESPPAVDGLGIDNRSSVAICRRDALGEDVDDPRSLVSDDLPNSPLCLFLAFGNVGECWMRGFSLKL